MSQKYDGLKALSRGYEQLIKDKILGKEEKTKSKDQVLSKDPWTGVNIVRVNTE